MIELSYGVEGIEDLTYARYVDLIKDYECVAMDDWPREESLEVGDFGEVIIHSVELRVGRVTQIVRVDGDLVLLLHRERSDKLTVRAAAHTAARAAYLVEQVRQRWPNDIEEEDENEISIRFWYNTGHGPRNWTRKVVVPAWATVADNYPQGAEIAEMSEWQHYPHGGGKLILWHGKPGTGKTYAIRALASEWRQWCRVEYVTDPEAFFGSADYMMSVLMEAEQFYDPEDNEMKHRTRLIVCEDVGELMAVDAKERTGQSLSRLLNLTEGLIGQGLDIAILLTTNERLANLHPAVQRVGRCLSVLEFPPFDWEDAVQWLKNHDYEGEEPKIGKYSLADLYSALTAETLDHGRHPMTAGFQV